MEMRHQPRLLGDEPPQFRVDLVRIERGEPQACQIRHQGQQPARETAEARLARQIARHKR